MVVASIEVEYRLVGVETTDFPILGWDVPLDDNGAPLVEHPNSSLLHDLCKFLSSSGSN